MSKKDMHSGDGIRSEKANEAKNILGETFKDQGLLETALTHRSFSNEAKLEGKRVEDNERLEFLGDAVLGLYVAEIMYLEFPDMSEGEMAKLRSNLVNREVLAELASEMGLDRLMVLGKGAEKIGGRRRVSVLAGLMEAVIGAIYLDRGYQASNAFLKRILYGKTLEKAAEPAEVYADPKTRLQELCAKKWGELPRYHTVRSEGPDHDRSFSIEVVLPGGERYAGKGKSKKKAEQEAAKRALEIVVNSK